MGGCPASKTGAQHYRAETILPLIWRKSLAPATPESLARRRALCYIAPRITVLRRGRKARYNAAPSAPAGRIDPR